MFSLSSEKNTFLILNLRFLVSLRPEHSCCYIGGFPEKSRDEDLSYISQGSGLQRLLASDQLWIKPACAMVSFQTAAVKV